MVAPLIIVGMHRSGTSLVTRCQEASGLFIGHRLGKHAEALSFHTANVAMLCAQGAEWDVPDEALEAMSDPGKRALLKNLARAHLSGKQAWSFLGPKILRARGRIGEHLPFAWGFKDPRTSIFLPIWLATFPQARLLRVRRHGVDVAASLAVREARRDHPGRCADIDAGLALWAQYESALDRWLAAVPEARQMAVRFEDYAAHPATIQARIDAFAGLPGTPGRPILPEAERSFAYRKSPELRKVACGFAETLASHGYEP